MCYIYMYIRVERNRCINEIYNICLYISRKDGSYNKSVAQFNGESALLLFN